MEPIDWKNLPSPILPETPLIRKAFKYLERELEFGSLGQRGRIPFICVSYAKGKVGIDAGISLESGCRFEVWIRFLPLEKYDDYQWSPLDRDFRLDCRELDIPVPTINGPFDFPAREPSFQQCLLQHANALRQVLTHPNFSVMR